MDDRFEVGRDLGLSVIDAISKFQDQLLETTGMEATTFEIIGVLHMVAADHHDQLRRNTEGK